MAAPALSTPPPPISQVISPAAVLSSLATISDLAPLVLIVISPLALALLYRMSPSAVISILPLVDRRSLSSVTPTPCSVACINICPAFIAPATLASIATLTAPSFDCVMFSTRSSGATLFLMSSVPVPASSRSCLAALITPCICALRVNRLVTSTRLASSPPGPITILAELLLSTVIVSGVLPLSTAAAPVVNTTSESEVPLSPGAVGVRMNPQPLQLIPLGFDRI